MIRIATLVRAPLACALAAAVLTAVAPAAASTVPTPPVQTATDPAVSIEAVRAWLTSKGGEVGAVQRQDGYVWIGIDDGPLHWVIFFYDCRDDVCGAIQYSATFSNPTITQTMINDWNREQRFLKAFFAPGEPGRDNTAVAQYDVLVHSSDVEQLAEHTALWLDLVGAFGTTVGYFTPAE